MAMYAVSDLHGMYNLWEQIKNFIKEELQKNTITIKQKPRKRGFFFTKLSYFIGKTPPFFI